MTVAETVTKREKKKDSSKLSSFDRFAAVAYKLFGAQGKKMASSTPQMREQILKSNLRISPDGLISLSIFAAVLSLVPVAICIGLALTLGISYFFIAVVAPPIVFVIVWNLPKISQGSRSSALDNELAMFIGFMSVLSGGGVSPIATMRRVSQMGNIFPAASKEAKRILVDIEVFGMDPISAFENAAKYNPNRSFSEFLYGYTTVLKVGGNVKSYVNLKLKETMDQRSSKVKRASDSVGTLAEAYLTVTAVMGITLFSLFQVEGILTHSDSGLTMLYAFAYLLIPVVSGLFIFILDGTGPKQPYVNTRPYYIYLASIPVGIALFLVPLPLPLSIHVSVALAATLVVPSVVAFRQGRDRASLERALPDFIRDVAEGRKIGLSPESSIEQLVSKNYGRLSSSIRTMASQISWGLPVVRVIKTFVQSVDSWLTKTIGTLMIEVVDVGGGTVGSFSDMADFTRKINELESEKKSSLRSYVIVVYMAGLLLVLTTFMMVYFLSQPMASGGAASSAVAGLTVSPATTQSLLTASIFDSYVIGIVAGKMGGGGVADGFKHGLALVVISALLVTFSAAFLSPAAPAKP